MKKDINEVKLVNRLQVAKYIENGVQPIRIELGDNGKLLFVFSKQETNHLYTKWLNREI